MKRSWIRLWIKESLRGSIRIDLTPAERSVWYDLLLMAGESREPGIIQAGNNQPLPMEVIATWLMVPLELLNSTIEKCVSEGRIELNNGYLKIANWKKYQGNADGKIKSEHQKQKIDESDNSNISAHRTMIVRQYKKELGREVTGEEISKINNWIDKCEKEGRDYETIQGGDPLGLFGEN